MNPIRRILCPVDFSAPSQAALECAETIARPFGAQLIVAHVILPMVYPVAYGLPRVALSNYEQDATANATLALAPLIDGIRGRGGRARSLVTTGMVSQRICELAAEEEADLVVLATHGLSGFQRVILGSTAERVVRHCPVPVLTVRSTGDAAGSGSAAARENAGATPVPMVAAKRP